MTTLHCADDIAFVKRLLDAMFETNNTVYCCSIIIDEDGGTSRAECGRTGRFGLQRREGVDAKGEDWLIAKRLMERRCSWMHAYRSLSPLFRESHNRLLHIIPNTWSAASMPLESAKRQYILFLRATIGR